MNSPTVSRWKKYPLLRSYFAYVNIEQAKLVSIDDLLQRLGLNEAVEFHNIDVITFNGYLHRRKWVRFNQHFGLSD